MTATVTKKKAVVVIHVLANGRALCKFSTKDYHQWPQGNYWVALTDKSRRDKVTCPACKKGLKK